MKKLLLENDCYSIVVFYFGEYDDDKRNGVLSLDNVTMNCRVKKNSVPALVMVSNAEITLDISSEPALRLTDVKSHVKKIDFAHDSAKELQKILQSYFVDCTGDGGGI